MSGDAFAIGALAEQHGPVELGHLRYFAHRGGQLGRGHAFDRRFNAAVVELMCAGALRLRPGRDPIAYLETR